MPEKRLPNPKNVSFFGRKCNLPLPLFKIKPPPAPSAPPAGAFGAGLRPRGEGLVWASGPQNSMSCFLIFPPASFLFLVILFFYTTRQAGRGVGTGSGQEVRPLPLRPFWRRHIKKRMSPKICWSKREGVAHYVHVFIEQRVSGKLVRQHGRLGHILFFLYESDPTRRFGWVGQFVAKFSHGACTPR